MSFLGIYGLCVDTFKRFYRRKTQRAESKCESTGREHGADGRVHAGAKLRQTGLYWCRQRVLNDDNYYTYIYKLKLYNTE